MKLGDADLEAGYEANIDYMLSGLGIGVDWLKRFDVPVKVPNFSPYVPGTKLAQGLDTPSGKFELYSELIAAHPDWGLDPLPTYCGPLDEADPEQYPYVLCSGGRPPHAIHTRLHKVEWLRSMQPEPTAHISVEDARALGLKEGDGMELFTERGSVCVKAKPSHRVQKGVVFFYHGYSEADVNSLMSKDHVDPYSGFPAYNATRCGMRKEAEG